MNGADLADKMQVEQALRRSHCALTDRTHECAGTMTITPSGLTLSCGICGSDERSLGVAQWNQHLAIAARSILYAAGLDFDMLAAETQANVVQRLQEKLRELNPD